jgi:hypothetical protein
MLTAQTRHRSNLLNDDNLPIQSPEDGALAVMMMLMKVSIEDVRSGIEHAARPLGLQGRARTEQKARRARAVKQARDAAHFLDHEGQDVAQMLSACGVNLRLPTLRRRLCHFKAATLNKDS